jgi:TldD protein
VPVSAVAPAMLMSEMETQRQPQGTSRPPILPIPGAPTAQGTGSREQGSGETAGEQKEAQ